MSYDGLEIGKTQIPIREFKELTTKVCFSLRCYDTVDGTLCL